MGQIRAGRRQNTAPAAGALGGQERRLDLRGHVCPLAFVRCKLALEQMAGGAVARIVTDDRRSVESMPLSLQLEGHDVLEVHGGGPGPWEIVVRCGRSTAG